MLLTEKFLFGLERYRGTAYNGMLSNRLQPAVLLMDPHGGCRYFLPFGLNTFRRAWDVGQESIENVVVGTVARHKLITHDELSFLLDYEGIAGTPNIRALVDFAKDYDRCTFTMTGSRLTSILYTLHDLEQHYSACARTLEYNEDNSKMENNYVFALSIYKLDTIIANLRDKVFTGFGLAIEVFNKHGMCKYNMVLPSYGSYQIYTNNPQDVLYRDCVPIFQLREINYAHIIDRVHSFHKYQVDEQSIGHIDYSKKKTNMGIAVPSIGTSNGKYIPISSKRMSITTDDDEDISDDDDMPRKMAKAPSFAESIAASAMKAMKKNPMLSKQLSAVRNVVVSARKVTIDYEAVPNWFEDGPVVEAMNNMDAVKYAEPVPIAEEVKAEDLWGVVPEPMLEIKAVPPIEAVPIPAPAAPPAELPIEFRHLEPIEDYGMDFEEEYQLKMDDVRSAEVIMAEPKKSNKKMTSKRAKAVAPPSNSGQKKVIQEDQMSSSQDPLEKYIKGQVEEVQKELKSMKSENDKRMSDVGRYHATYEDWSSSFASTSTTTISPSNYYIKLK